MAESVATPGIAPGFAAVVDLERMAHFGQGMAQQNAMVAAAAESSEILAMEFANREAVAAA